MAARSGIADRIELAGPLTEDRVRFALSGTDLLVSASRRESYGMAVAEALAHGVPVVVTDVGGHHEAVGRPPTGARPACSCHPTTPTCWPPPCAAG